MGSSGACHPSYSECGHRLQRGPAGGAGQYYVDTVDLDSSLLSLQSGL